MPLDARFAQLTTNVVEVRDQHFCRGCVENLAASSGNRNPGDCFVLYVPDDVAARGAMQHHGEHAKEASCQRCASIAYRLCTLSIFMWFTLIIPSI